jgi:hypothetical protein
MVRTPWRAAPRSLASHEADVDAAVTTHDVHGHASSTGQKSMRITTRRLLGAAT